MGIEHSVISHWFCRHRDDCGLFRRRTYLYGDQPAYAWTKDDVCPRRLPGYDGGSNVLRSTITHYSTLPLINYNH